MKKTLGPFTFEIDRPEGTIKEWPGGKRFVYPCDYGYWPKLFGEDGEGLDAFVGDDPNGHLESFQKLKREGDRWVPDETKFLLGVNDRQRESIYRLYGPEVNARRVYDGWEDVERAIDVFPTKAHKTAAHRYGEKLAETPRDLSALVGKPEYYMARAADFRARHPDLRAPDYYTDYGDKYVHRFSTALRPKLSPPGQEWLDRTRADLQRRIETARAKDPDGFDALEKDPVNFKAFAFGTHAPAYVESGLGSLSLKDKLRIGLTPDLKDVLSRDGLSQVAQVFHSVNSKTAEHEHRWSYGYLPGFGYRHCGCGHVDEVNPDGATRPAKASDKALVLRKVQKTSAYAFGERLAELQMKRAAPDPFVSLNWVPSPYATRMQTPYEVISSARTTPALASTQENLKLLQMSQNGGDGAVTPTHHRRHRHH